MALSATAGKAEPSDAELIQAVADDDGVAFAALFGRYAMRIRAFMLRAGASEPDADEVVQDVMISIWRRAASFDPAKAAAATWIFAIARNRRIDMIRRGRRPAPDPRDPLVRPAPVPDGAAQMSLAEREAAVRRRLAALAPEQRDVLRLAFYDGLSHSEIAEATGLPLGTVKSRIRLALRHMRGALDKDLAGEVGND